MPRPKKTQKSPDEWQDLIYQAIRFKEEFCSSQSWGYYRDCYRGDFFSDSLNTNELNYNVT